MLCLFFPIFITLIFHSICAEEYEYVSRAQLREELDWRAYLELHPDIAKYLSSKDEAVLHFLKYGEKERRKFPKIFPSQPGFGIAHKKLMTFTKSLDVKNIPLESRTFIIYNVEVISKQHSLDAAINNMKIFNAAVEQDATNNSTNFYWFNIIEKKDNRLSKHVIQIKSPNIAVVDRTVAPNGIFVHLRTLSLFKHTLEKKFGSVLCLSQHIRGPVHYHEHVRWLAEYRKLLFQPKVGIVGPTISCERNHPHVQTHLFLIRTKTISWILNEYNNLKKPAAIDALGRFYTQGISDVIVANHYKLASYLYAQRIGPSTAALSGVFNGHCLPNEEIEHFANVSDPSKWCHIAPHETLFYVWAGDFIRLKHLCPQFVTQMHSMIASFHSYSNSIYWKQLRVPEVLQQSAYYDLYQAYQREISLPIVTVPATSSSTSSGSINGYSNSNSNSHTNTAAEKVCFFVRASAINDVPTVLFDESKSILDHGLDTGIHDFIRCK